MPVTIDGTTGVSLASTNSVPTAALQDSAVTTAKIAAGAVATVDIADAAVTGAKLSGAQTGTAPIYGARAWVNWNGTGTVAIRSSGNVTSITDNGVGAYTVNFTTAMPDTAYAMTGSARWELNTVNLAVTPLTGGTYTASAIRVLVYESRTAADARDADIISVVIVR